MSYNSQEIREKYKELFDHSLDLIFTFDLEGNLLDVNDITLKTLGYTREEFLKINWRDLLNKDVLQKADKNVKELIDTGHQSDFAEYKVKTKAGDFVYLQVIGLPLKKEGKTYAFLGIGKDITDLVSAHEKIRRTEKKYQNLFENTPFSIVLLNRDGIIVDCNPTVETMLGYTKKEILGRHFRNISVIHPDFLSYIALLFMKLIKGEIVHRTDLQMYKKDGTLIWANIQGSMLKIGRKSFVQVLITDISKRRSLIQKLIESENLYKALVRTSPDAIVVTKLKYK
jgi:PAS domain S-box-containing protein